MRVLLGSNGQITSQLARRLLAQGHPVRVVGRSAATLMPLAKAGAQIAIGSPADADFLTQALRGATAAYTMIPPCYDAEDMREAQDRIGEAIATAIRAAGVPRVVNLSSIGAELAQGTGPIEGLHAQELRLQAIPGISLLNLRPGSFMENLLGAIPTVLAEGVLPGLESPDVLIPMVATRDVAAVAARELTAATCQGTLLLHAAAAVSMRQATQAIGGAIGRPDLPYLQASEAEGQAALRAQGLSADAARQIEALARWLSTTAAASATAGPVEIQPTGLEAFVQQVFMPALTQSQAQSKEAGTQQP